MKMRSISTILEVKIQHEKRIKRLMKHLRRAESKGRLIPGNVLTKVEEARTQLENLCLEVRFI